MTLRDILAQLEQTYCGHVGVQYMHITNTEQKRWIQQRLETVRSTTAYTNDEKLEILDRLTAAEGLERYLHTNYVGQKRFSLEGGESLIPMLHTLIQHGGSLGAREMVIGMAHRGRLNVLVNVLGKAPGMLFGEFEGKYSFSGRTGDVKYHMGYASDLMTPGGAVHVAMAFNPSHLEIVGPVVQGAVRARQDRWDDAGGDKIIPVVLHGDAAFAGQGVLAFGFGWVSASGCCQSSGICFT
jgi:2-oxoglutarate dehydrogenase E1 component